MVKFPRSGSDVFRSRLQPFIQKRDGQKIISQVGAPGWNRTSDLQLRSLKPPLHSPIAYFSLDQAYTYEVFICALRWFPSDFHGFVLHRFYMAQWNVPVCVLVQR